MYNAARHRNTLALSLSRLKTTVDCGNARSCAGLCSWRMIRGVRTTAATATPSASAARQDDRPRLGKTSGFVGGALVGAVLLGAYCVRCVY